MLAHEIEAMQNIISAQKTAMQEYARLGLQLAMLRKTCDHRYPDNSSAICTKQSNGVTKCFCKICQSIIC